VRVAGKAKRAMEHADLSAAAAPPAAIGAADITGAAVAPFAGMHVLLLAAHPDDEMLGAGGQFPAMRRLSLVHLTDGAPSHREAWRRGCRSRRAYARTRRREAIAAASCGNSPFEHFDLGCRDLRAALEMARPTSRLARIIRERVPDLVLTHPYEGGHPDHDAAAFVALWACRLAGDVPLWEMASYHAASAHREGAAAATGRIGGIPVVSGRFLDAPDGSAPPIAVRLSGTAYAAKRLMIDCFGSQRRELEELGADLSTERFRPAPAYDFNRPPHDGALLYEMQAWARIEGARWRSLAAQAAAVLAAS
jgi:N-acetylglucosamine malate deacetylase 2